MQLPRVAAMALAAVVAVAVGLCAVPVAGQASGPCTVQADCGTQDYCDTSEECRNCFNCATLQNSITGACPAKCANLNVGTIDIVAPGAGESFNTQTQTNITWAVANGGFSDVRIFLVRSAGFQSLGVVATVNPVASTDFLFDIPRTIPTDTYLYALTTIFSNRVVATSDPFTITQAKCASHAECDGSSYCDSEGFCFGCSACLEEFDAVDGRCPAKCGFTSVQIGDRIPNEDEVVVVGPVKDFVRPGCPLFATLVVSTDPNIDFSPNSAAGEPNRMTSRLSSKLSELAAIAVRDLGSKLAVQRAYEFPVLGSGVVPTLFNEARAARISLSSNASQARLSDLALIAAGVGLDFVFVEAATFLHVSVIPDSCTTPVDLVFLLDESGSVEAPLSGGSPGTFADRVIPFVQEVARFFDTGLGAAQSRVGVATFSSQATVEVNLRDGASGAGLEAAIAAIRFNGGGTRTSDGLRTVRQQMFTAAGGARDLSEGVPRVLVVVTDGQASPGFEPAAEAQLLRDSNVNIFSIGVGDGVRVSELNEMASDPDERHVVLLKSFSRIDDIVDSMRSVACEAPAIAPTGVETVASIADCELKFFSPLCGTSTNLRIELRTLSGRVHLFASRTTAFPGPFDNELSDVTANASKTLLLARPANDTRPVTVSVQGADPAGSTFSLVVLSDLFATADPATLDVVLEEDAAPGLTVFTAPPLDAAPPGDAFDFALRAGNDQGLFAVNPADGTVTLARALDVESNTTFVLRYAAVSRATPCLTGEVDLRVTVINKLRGAPAFQGAPFAGTVAESSPPGTEVFRVSASNPEGGLSFALVELPARRRRRDGEGLPFAIGPDGAVTTTAALDAEVQSSFDFAVVATTTSLAFPGLEATAQASVTIASVTCPPGSASGDGTFPCAACPAGTFADAAGATECRPCACPAGAFQTAECTPATPPECAVATACDPASEFETAAPTPTSDRVCAELAACDPAGEFETAAPTPTSDRVCAELTPCGAGEFESEAPTPTSDRVCAEVVDPCEPNPCLNGGVCAADPASGLGFACACPPTHTGPRCEVVDACALEPCAPGSRCTSTPEGAVCDACSVGRCGPCCLDPLGSCGANTTCLTAQEALDRANVPDNGANNDGNGAAANLNGSLAGAIIGALIGALVLILLLIALVRRRSARGPGDSGKPGLAEAGALLGAHDNPLYSGVDGLLATYRRVQSFDHQRYGRAVLAASADQVQASYRVLSLEAPPRADLGLLAETLAPQLRATVTAANPAEAADFLDAGLVDFLVELAIDKAASLSASHPAYEQLPGAAYEAFYDDIDGYAPSSNPYLSPADLLPPQYAVGDAAVRDLVYDVAEGNPDYALGAGAPPPGAEAVYGMASAAPGTGDSTYEYALCAADEAVYSMGDGANGEYTEISDEATGGAGLYDRGAARPEALYDYGRGLQDDEQTGMENSPLPRRNESLYALGDMDGEGAQAIYTVASPAPGAPGARTLDFGLYAAASPGDPALYAMASPPGATDPLYSTATDLDHRHGGGEALYDNADSIQALHRAGGGERPDEPVYALGNQADGGPLYSTAQAVLGGRAMPTGQSYRLPQDALIGGGGGSPTTYDLPQARGPLYATATAGGGEPEAIYDAGMAAEAAGPEPEALYDVAGAPGSHYSFGRRTSRRTAEDITTFEPLVLGPLSERATPEPPRYDAADATAPPTYDQGDGHGIGRGPLYDAAEQGGLEGEEDEEGDMKDAYLTLRPDDLEVDAEYDLAAGSAPLRHGAGQPRPNWLHRASTTDYDNIDAAPDSDSGSDSGSGSAGLSAGARPLDTVAEL